MGYVASDVSDLQAAFYEAAANPDAWSGTLGQFARSFKSRGCLLTTPRFTEGGIPHSPGMRDVLDQFFSQNWHTRDLRTKLALARNCRKGFFSDDDLLSRDEMKASSYYRGFANNAGVPWFSAAILSEDAGGDFIAISLQRSASDGAFSGTDKARLNSILPQLKNATQMALRFATLRGRSIVEGLDTVSEAAILMDRHGKILHLNDHARTLDPALLKIIHGSAAGNSSAQAAGLGALVARACATLSGVSGSDLSPVVLRSPVGKAVAIVRAAPVNRSGSDVLGFEGVVLMITTLNRAKAVDTSVAREAFGLTAREAEVLGLIGEEPTLGAIGHSLDISREAVRFHLKSIFLKTDTHRQQELVALLCRLNFD